MDGDPIDVDWRGARAFAIKLDTPSKIGQWNAAVDTMVASKPTWFASRLKWSLLDTAGLDYARIDADRVNPHVAVVTEGTRPDLAIYAASTADELFEVLGAFVPFSVITDDRGRKLVLPMGLQKTPSGHGFTSPPVHNAQRPQTAPLRGALSALLGAIRKTIGPHAILTRFATREKFNNAPGLLWNSKMIQRWEALFPGRIKFYRRQDRVDVDSPAAPDTYAPGNGGVWSDGSTVEITDAEGRVVFRITDGHRYHALRRLQLDGAYQTHLGVLLAAWTAPAFVDVAALTPRGRGRVPVRAHVGVR